MQALGPYENTPHLCVAVSGGADSIALALLAHQWAKQHSGRITSLSVDHKLREASTQEAVQVEKWMHHHGIAHHTLMLESLPQGNLQAAAREARYDALSRWCRENHVLHLLVGHHADDQAETIAMRAARGDDSLGTAGMSKIRRTGSVRLLRPLLFAPKTQLTDFLLSQAQEWIEDPSNQEEAFERVKLRNMFASNPQARTEAMHKGAATAQTRSTLERQTASWLATHTHIYGAGYAMAELSALPKDAASSHHILAALIQTISGDAYRPRSASLANALEQRSGQSTVSLGGCLITRTQKKHLIYREPNAIGTAQPLSATHWDQRFQVDTSLSDPQYRVDALGEAGWLSLKPHFDALPLPRSVLPTLPALWHLDTPLCVPHIGYALVAGMQKHFTCRFTPRKPLAGAPFTAMNA